jgi:hypothetical protein
MNGVFFFQVKKLQRQKNSLKQRNPKQKASCEELYKAQKYTKDDGLGTHIFEKNVILYTFDIL